MNLLSFYIYWILGANHIERCKDDVSRNSGICLSKRSCTKISEGTIIGLCEIKSADVCCKIRWEPIEDELSPAFRVKLHTIAKKYNESSRAVDIYSSSTQTNTASGGSQLNYFAPFSSYNHLGKYFWGIFPPLVVYGKPVETAIDFYDQRFALPQRGHDLRFPVTEDRYHDLRSPVWANRDPTHRQPVVPQRDHDLRRPVLLEKNHDLRRHVMPDEGHDLRWPVLEEDSHDLRNTAPPYQYESIHKKVTSTTERNTFSGNYHNFPSGQFMYNVEKAFSQCMDTFSLRNSNVPNKYEPVNIERAEEKSQHAELLDAASEVCGISQHNERVRAKRLVGGKNSKYLQWPWMVSLQKSKSVQHFCGASLLSQLWVVTAAHCVSLIPKRSIALRLGNYNLQSDNEAHAYMDRSVEQKILHPDFKPLSYENDIALLLMDAPVEFRPNIAPICLPRNVGDLEGRIAVILGWGSASEYGHLSDILQELYLPVLSNRECERMHAKVGEPEKILDGSMCAGNPGGGSDACLGDSGGPMMILDSNERWSLIGLVSWGKVCGAPNQPGVYTRIASFINWIDGIMACYEKHPMKYSDGYF